MRRTLTLLTLTTCLAALTACGSLPDSDSKPSDDTNAGGVSDSIAFQNSDGVSAPKDVDSPDTSKQLPPDTALLYDTMSDSDGPAPGNDVADETTTTDGESATKDADATDSCPGGSSCACASHAECNSGVCADDSSGKVCAQTCDGGCKSGWTCAQTAGKDGTSVSVCLPTAPHSCDPCLKSAECESYGSSGNMCVRYGPAGNFCGVKCRKFYIPNVHLGCDRRLESFVVLRLAD